MKMTFKKMLAAVALLTATLLPVASHAITIPHVGPHWHILDGFSDKDLLRLEDGSEWRAASPAEAYTAYSWQPGDHVYITPNNGVFTASSYYPFYLNNFDRGTYIRVVPVSSPIHFGEFSYWLFGTNLTLGHATIVSGQQGGLMTWDVSSSYSYILRDWDPNDHIVIGLYDSLFSFLSSYNYVLINFNKANYVQARPH